MYMSFPSNEDTPEQLKYYINIKTHLTILNTFSRRKCCGNDCGVMRAKAEWRTDLKIFLFFFFQISKIKNVSSFLGQIEGKGMWKAWSYKAPLEALNASLNLIRFYVSCSESAATLWNSLNGTIFWLSKKSQDITITAIFLSVFYSCVLHPIELCKKLPPPFSSGFKKATFRNSAKYIHVLS